MALFALVLLLAPIASASEGIPEEGQKIYFSEAEANCAAQGLRQAYVCVPLPNNPADDVPDPEPGLIPSSNVSDPNGDPVYPDGDGCYEGSVLIAHFPDVVPVARAYVFNPEGASVLGAQLAINDIDFGTFEDCYLPFEEPREGVWAKRACGNYNSKLLRATAAPGKILKICKFQIKAEEAKDYLLLPDPVEGLVRATQVVDENGVPVEADRQGCYRGDVLTGILPEQIKAGRAYLLNPLGSSMKSAALEVKNALGQFQSCGEKFPEKKEKEAFDASRFCGDVPTSEIRVTAAEGRRLRICRFLVEPK